jgi:hypothetical protein
MELAKRQILTIVAESILEEQICEKILELGATGYTVIESRGHGSLGRNAGIIPGINIRIETIVKTQVAEEIMKMISSEYFEKFSIICFITEASVLREEKY